MSVKYNEFEKYCSDGNIIKLKQLLFPPIASEIQRPYNKYKIDIHYGNEIGFINACESKKLYMVKYLTTLYKTHKYKNDRIDINITINDGFYENKQTLNMFCVMCEEGNLKIIKYLINLYLTDGYPPIDIHICNEFAFRSAIANGHFNVVRYMARLYRHHKVYKPIDIYMNTYKRHRGSYYDFIYKCTVGGNGIKIINYMINLGLYNGVNKFIL